MNRFIFEYNVDEQLPCWAKSDVVIDILHEVIAQLSGKSLSTQSHVKLCDDSGTVVGGYWVEQVPG